MSEPDQQERARRRMKKSEADVLKTRRMPLRAAKGGRHLQDAAINRALRTLVLRRPQGCKTIMYRVSLIFL